jgi:hypothetical protein
MFNNKPDFKRGAWTGCFRTSLDAVWRFVRGEESWAIWAMISKLIDLNSLDSLPGQSVTGH